MNAILEVFNLETLLNYNYLDIYSTFLVFALLTIASYFDSRTLKIPNKLNLYFLILRILLILLMGFGYGNLFGFFAGGLIILIPAMIKLKPMGGDIKMMSIVGLYIGFQNILILMIISIILSAIYYGIVFFKKQEFKDTPLAPFILAGFTIVNFIKII